MFKTTTFALLIGSIAIFSSAHAGEVGLSLEENSTLGAEENSTLDADGSGPAPSLPGSSSIAAEIHGSWELFDVPMVD